MGQSGKNQELDGRGVPGWHENGGNWGHINKKRRFINGFFLFHEEKVNFFNSFNNKVDDLSRILHNISSKKYYTQNLKLAF